MPKFCEFCGSELDEGVKFCTKCGAQIPQTAQSIQDPDTQRENSAQTDPIPQQQPVYQQPTPKKAKKKKKGKGCLITIIIFLAIIAVGAVLFLGFRDDGWFRRKSPENLESPRAYAERLEKDGNKEAAAAIYDLIAQSGGEMIQKAHEDIPVLNKADEIDQFGQVFGK